MTSRRGRALFVKATTTTTAPPAAVDVDIDEENTIDEGGSTLTQELKGNGVSFGFVITQVTTGQGMVSRNVRY